MGAFHRIDRRGLLRLAAASASTLWLPRSAWGQARLQDNPFTLGVASGSPADTSFVLWTRLVAPSLGQAPVTVRWEVASDDGFRNIVQRGQAQALPELAHSVHVEVQGLAPDRWYFYRFAQGDWTTRTGRTRTLPAADADVQRVRIAYASCQRWDHGYFAAWRHMLADQPDFVLFLGDYIYEYPGLPNAVRRPQGLFALTLEDYRQRHAEYKTDPDLQAMHAACPWFMTWDDHEVQNDYAGDHPGNGGPDVDHIARRAAAYRAYYEHMPLRAAVLTRAFARLDAGAEMRVYSQARLGRLGRLCLLDARQYKDRQVCTSGGRNGSSLVNPDACATWDDPARSMLGKAQEQWLDAWFAQQGQGWNIVAQSTLFGRVEQRTRTGTQFWNDGWDGYAAARRRITQSLEGQAVRNAVMFGGDVHQNWVGHIKADYDRPESKALGVEFCGTSITSRNSLADRLPGWLADNPHFVYADARWRGWGIADFTPSQLSVRLSGVESPERADSGARTLASFVVQAGRPSVEKA